jgi:aminopeptidase-like protein
VVEMSTGKEQVDCGAVVDSMFDLMERLYPICRSITGKGFRETLGVLGEYIPLRTHEVPTGTQVFDWTVPKEWNIADAYVKNSKGERVIDFKQSNLHVVGYSTPIHTFMPLAQLKGHLHTLPEHPGWIPYRTCYYQENWGFCLTHRQLLEMPAETYEVCIDATLADGYLTYGECTLPGRRSDEVLLSCHACHPSLCNDNLSGVALTTFLGKTLANLSREYSYRILFIPGTIGAITWLALNEEHVDRIKHGLVVTCVGDSGNVTYKRSRRGDAEVDRAAAYVLKSCGQPHRVVDFSPYGYDERQYCSPGFNLPVGCLQRTPHGQYPEYHTSADDLQFVSRTSLADSFSKYLAVLNILEHNKKYLNTHPKCEPQLGKRGLYTAIGGQSDTMASQMALLWVLNLSDGGYSLLDIAERSGLDFNLLKWAAAALLERGLLQECHESVEGRDPLR